MIQLNMVKSYNKIISNILDNLLSIEISKIINTNNRFNKNNIFDQVVIFLTPKLYEYVNHSKLIYYDFIFKFYLKNTFTKIKNYKIIIL